MNRATCISVLAALALIALPYSAMAQVESARSRLLAREDALKGWKITWKLEESSKLYARRDVGEIKGMGVRFDYDDQSWTHTADYVFARGQKNMVVNGTYAVFNSDRKAVDKVKLVLMYSDGVAGALRYNNVLHPDSPTVTEFVSTSKFGAKSSNPLDGSAVILPEAFIFLAGFAPDGVYGMRWGYSTDAQGRIVATGKNFDEEDKILNTNLRNHWTVRITFDAETLCPLSGSFLQETTPGESYVCEGFQKVGDVVVPSKVTMTLRLGPDVRPMFDTTRVWRFASAKRVDEVEFPVPKGTLVGDYRLDVKDLHLWLFPPKGAEPVMYAWDSRLPTLDELRGIRAGKPLPRQRELPKWALPASLVTVGAVWLGLAVRKRALRRKQA